MPAGGEDKTRCGSTKTDGTREPCKNPAGWGTDHVGYGSCKRHAGNAPSQKIFASKLEAREQLMGMGDPIDIDPHTALLDCVRLCAGTVLWLANKIRTTESVALLELGGENGILQPNAWVKLHGEYVDRLARIAKVCIDVGVEERYIAMYEEQGRWLVKALDLIVERIELSDTQRLALPGVMAEVIDVLEAGKDPSDIPSLDHAKEAEAQATRLRKKLKLDTLETVI